MKCYFCNSTNVRVSKSYSDMWFCRDCGKGDYLNNKQVNVNRYPLVSIVDGIINEVIDRDEKTLFICQKSIIRNYVSQNKGIEVFDNILVEEDVDDYERLVNEKKGLFLFNSEHPSWFISNDYKSFNFDNIIIVDCYNDYESQVVKEVELSYDLGNKGQTNLYIFS